MRVISYTEARNSLRSLLDHVIDDADVAIIHCRDSENAVLMSQRQYESLMETLHLSSTAANVRHLNKSLAQYRAGKAKSRSLVNSVDE